MNDHRWKQISRLYHAGLARDESQRAEFLGEACGEDDELRREVESLLARERKAEGFLSAPAIEMAAKAMAQGGSQPGLGSGIRECDLVGHQIGGYQILSRLGAGGMGEVYRARDSRLGRDVAIKVLPSLFASDAERLRRFEREARLLASLNHPHIGAIYGVEDGSGGAIRAWSWSWSTVRRWPIASRAGRSRSKQR